LKMLHGTLLALASSFRKYLRLQPIRWPDVD